MKILHYYPENDESIAMYVSTLCQNMSVGMACETVTDAVEAVRRVKSIHYDILHLHGCWQNAMHRIARQACKQKTRLVVTPHGQLEPWVMRQHFLREKLPKRLAYQQHIISHAYAVVIQGKMEQECMERLAWNPRTVTIKNSLLTHSISASQMAQQMFKLYRRIMDSNTLEFIPDSHRQAIRQYIKAGITGDCRWISGTVGTISGEEEWRRVYCLAQQEGFLDVMQRGMTILNVPIPDTPSGTDCFLPHGYHAPQSIQSAIGSQFISENQRLLATFKHLRQLIQKRQLTTIHLIELDRELRFHDCEEDQLSDTLQDRKLYYLCRRVMHLLAENTGFDEGFMPLSPLKDRTTLRIQKQIENHLKI